MADGCERNDPASLVEASRKFTEIESYMNVFISKCTDTNDNAILMINDRNILQVGKISI